MASIRFGAGIVDARGSISGQTFSRNASGAYIRARVAGTNPRTEQQQQARQRFGAISSEWRALDVKQAQSWIDAAQTTLGRYVNRLGEQAQYTGQQLYSKLNNVRALFGNGPLLEAPLPESLTDVIVSSPVVEYDPATGEIETMTLTVAMGGAGRAQDLLIYTSGEVSPGLKRPASAPRIWIGAIEAQTSGTIDVLPLWLARGLPDKKKDGEQNPPPDSRIYYWVVPASARTGQTAAEVLVSTAPVASES